MELFKNIKSNNQERKEKELVGRASQIFQVQEHRGELWLTVNDNPIIPASFLKDDVLEALTKVRELFIQERIERKNLCNSNN